MPPRRKRIPGRVASDPRRDSVTALFSRWMLRLLVGTGALRALAHHRRPLEAESLAALGIEASPEAIDSPIELKDTLAEQLERLETEPAENRLLNTTRTLGERLGLTQTEQHVLAYLALEEVEADTAQTVLGAARSAERQDTPGLLAIALDCPVQELRDAFHPDSPLLRAGLVQPERRGPGFDESTGYDLLSGLAATLLAEDPEPDTFLRSYFRPAPASALDADDFPHLATDLARLTRLLGRAAANGEPGVNVLLHGPPGTGKTELARVIAREAGLEALEVNHETASGQPLEPRQRQRAYQLCQHLTGRDRTATILFDEVEDIFAREGPMGLPFGRDRESAGGKATLNQLLENNPVPALWLTNDHGPLDGAHLRRFAWTVEVGPPPASVRRGILVRAIGDLPVSEEWLDRTATVEGLTPAEADRAARTARLASDGEPADVEDCLDRHLQRQARLQGRRPPTHRRGADALPFRLEHLRPEPAIEPVLDDLALAGDGTALLHGPPGTGKTALAHHLAERMERPLISRPASAILSPWVGQTEANLAALFREAADQEAVLMLDEADSLLAGRERARAEWEVTRTNELLVQIEAFPGVLLCATNRLEALDEAALRRFDHKVALRPLNREQRKELFADLLATLGSELEDPGRALDDLDNLTPGDFATLARRHRRRVERTGEAPTADEMLGELAQESRAKPGGERQIGFL